MSLKKILDTIIKDADAEAQKIILESREKADRIKKEAEKRASELAEALVQDAEKQAQLEASRLITQARLETKINILSQKKELIQQVLERSFQKKDIGDRVLKRKVITKDGEKEEPFDEEKLKEELLRRLENKIIEALEI